MAEQFAVCECFLVDAGPGNSGISESDAIQGGIP
jgi:hypothetical protein